MAFQLIERNTVAVTIKGILNDATTGQPQPFDFEDVFDASFMHKYTRYRSLEKFLTGSRLPIASQKDFEELPEEKMDAFVKKASKFSSWQEMLDFATDRYARRKRS